MDVQLELSTRTPEFSVKMLPSTNPKDGCKERMKAAKLGKNEDESWIGVS